MMPLLIKLTCLQFILNVAKLQGFASLGIMILDCFRRTIIGNYILLAEVKLLTITINESDYPVSFPVFSVM